MSKRRRNKREDVRPADHSGRSGTPHHRDPHDEPQITVSGEALAKFDAWIDAELETLVGRWVHLAAPAASTVRRVIPKDSRRHSGQA